MALPETVNLNLYAGDSWSQTFRLLIADTPVDLTGATIAAWARPCISDNGHLILQCGLGENPGEVYIAPPVGGGFAPDTYSYDLEVTMADGRVTTWVKGRL